MVSTLFAICLYIDTWYGYIHIYIYDYMEIWNHGLHKLFACHRS